MPSPARNTGTTTTSPATWRPGAGSSGVWTVTSRVGTSRRASAASSTLMRRAVRAELVGRRARVAQRDQRVLDERVGDEMDGHGGTIH